MTDYISEDEVRAVTNERLASRLGIPMDKALTYKGKVVIAVTENLKKFEQNCGPTLEKMRKTCQVELVEGNLDDLKPAKPQRITTTKKQVDVSE